MTVTLIVLTLAILMMVVERLKPGRVWPTVSTWWIRAIALNLVQVGIVFLAGYTWDGFLVRRRPWSADSLGVYGGALLGYGDAELRLSDMLVGRDVNRPVPAQSATA